MAVTIQDNFNLAAAKAVDNRYAKISAGGVSIPYADTTEAVNAIPLTYRHLGLTVCIADGTSIKEYWWKDGTANPDLVPKGGAVSGAANGLSVNSTNGNIELGGNALYKNTFVELLGNTLNLKSTALTAGGPAVSQTGITIVPGNDPKTFDLAWNLNINEFHGKNLAYSYSWFQENVGIGTPPEPRNSNTVTSDTRLKVVKSPGTSTNRLTSNPIAVASNSILEMIGTMGSGNTTIYSGSFNQLAWKPSANFNFATGGGSSNLTFATFSGTGSYLQITSTKVTTNSNMSASSQQVYTAAESSQYFTSVSSSTSGGGVTTITLSGSQTTSGINIGDQVLLKGLTGTGNFGYVNVYVRTISSTNTFTVGIITAGTYPSYTLSDFTPTQQLNGKDILVARANGGNPLGSIDKVIGARILGVAADRYSGASIRITNSVGLQIDNQRTIPNPSSPNSWINVDVTPGFVDNTYGILQVGTEDINEFNSSKNTFPNLVNVPTELDAKNAGVPRWGLFRTNEIIKIRTIA